jgi:hypothetical protein
MVELLCALDDPSEWTWMVVVSRISTTSGIGRARGAVLRFFGKSWVFLRVVSLSFRGHKF